MLRQLQYGSSQYQKSDTVISMDTHDTNKKIPTPVAPILKACISSAGNAFFWETTTDRTFNVFTATRDFSASWLSLRANQKEYDEATSKAAIKTALNSYNRWAANKRQTYVLAGWSCSRPIMKPNDWDTGKSLGQEALVFYPHRETAEAL